MTLESATARPGAVGSTGTKPGDSVTPQDGLIQFEEILEIQGDKISTIVKLRHVSEMAAVEKRAPGEVPSHVGPDGGGIDVVMEEEEDFLDEEEATEKEKPNEKPPNAEGEQGLLDKLDAMPLQTAGKTKSTDTIVNVFSSTLVYFLGLESGKYSLLMVNLSQEFETGIKVPAS